MQQPGADDDQRAGGHLDAGDHVVLQRPAGHHPRGRVEAQRLVDDGAGPRAAVGVLGEVGSEPVLDVGVLREQMQRPGQAGRDGLVSGDHERDELVADLVGVEAVEVVGRAQEQGEHVVPGVRTGGAALGDEVRAGAVQGGDGAAQPRCDGVGSQPGSRGQRRPGPADHDAERPVHGLDDAFALPAEIGREQRGPTTPIIVRKCVLDVEGAGGVPLLAQADPALRAASPTASSRP